MDSRNQPHPLTDADKAFINDFLKDCKVLQAPVVTAQELDHIRKCFWYDDATAAAFERLWTHYNQLRSDAAVPATPLA